MVDKIRVQDKNTPQSGVDHEFLDGLANLEHLEGASKDTRCSINIGLQMHGKQPDSSIYFSMPKDANICDALRDVIKLLESEHNDITGKEI